MDYDDQLDRALEAMPELTGSTDRLSIPEPDVEADGAFTRLRNVGPIAGALGREPDHLHRAIQRDLGTNGQFEDGQGRYNGSFTPTDFDEAINSYVEEYVSCSECGLPDTTLTVEDRTQMLRCDACGAFRPVTKRRTASATQPQPDIEVGETYSVEIVGIGRKGDGVAEKGNYTIFVPSAREGDVVKIFVESVSGTLAFARRIP